MFDLSMAEIGVIGVVALLVLGPERLPKAARTVGFYVRKARQSWYSVRSEFERELAAEELKRSLKLDEVHATLQATASELQVEMEATASTLNAARTEAGAVPSQTTGADPLPAPLALPVNTGTPAPEADFEEGLSAEERARQNEPMPQQALESSVVAERQVGALDAGPESSDTVPRAEGAESAVQDGSVRPEGRIGTA